MNRYEYAKQWRLKNPEKCTAAYERRKKRWAENPEIKARRLRNTFNRALVRTYGITLSQRNSILEKQKWLCKICV